MANSFKHCFTTILFLFIVSISYSQKEEGSFCVVTFERINNHHLDRSFYWIVNKDSLENRLYPFFLEEEYSFNPETIRDNDSVMYWSNKPADENYSKLLRGIIGKIKKNRFKIQTIRTKTSAPHLFFRANEKINVYLSFFYGTINKFSFYSLYRGSKFGIVEFKGKGYIPLDDFDIDKAPDNDFKKMMMKCNYSLFPFDYFLPEFYREQPGDRRNFQIKMNKEASRTYPIWEIWVK